MAETAEPLTVEKKDEPAGNKPPEPQAEPPRKPRLTMGRRIRTHPIKFLLFLILLAAAAMGGVRLWNYLDSYESTDDAQVDGDVYPITSRIAGMVTGVYVEDNQSVKAGQLLVDLDPKDYSVAAAQTRAALRESQTLIAIARPGVDITSVSTATTVSSSGSDLESAVAEVASAQKTHESAVADLRSAEADSVRAQADLARYQQLVAKDEISKQQFDQAEANARAMAARVEARRATAEADARDIEAAQARLQQARTRQNEAERNAPQQIAVQRATVLNRQATAEVQKTAVDQAELNLSYTKIFAPIDGVVGRKNVSVGQQVAAGQQLLLDVPLSNLWVTANFKETQLKRMHSGQRVTVHVDAYDRDLEGVVAELAGASGARFSLLPPENATGNYVKVVQRVPVRINLKEGQDQNHSLRPGMSVAPKVWLNN
jgi:membrane fusion protein (multidrug efflux system)